MEWSASKILVFFVVVFLFNCVDEQKRFENQYIWDSQNVTATAYNSLAYQTDANPNITAFGDSLKPGLKCIAVSRDLYRKGLKHNIPVKIEGLDGIYLVKDKMSDKWNNRIDIYMGQDVNAAKNWGRRRVCIEYGIPKKD
ncbi:3D domain-containing protein [Tamlana flava]|uniref:3D domain-containing protein n=1 Tax=Tamlana flava TaxID=3158572 RepID=UPI00351B9212